MPYEIITHGTQYKVYNTALGPNGTTDVNVVNSYAEAVKWRDLKNSRSNNSADKTLSGFRTAEEVAAIERRDPHEQRRLALASAAQSTVTDTNDPKKIILERKRQTQSKIETLVFPEGLTQRSGIQSGPHVVIKAYTYRRKLNQKEVLEPLYRIFLPMPPNVTQGYSAQLENFSGSVIVDALADKFGNSSGGDLAVALGAGGAAAAAAVVANVGISGLQQLIMEYADKRTNGYGGQVIQGAYYGMQDIRNQISTVAGASINPRYEVAFSSMNLRRHSFSFPMVPTSKTESETINKIVRQLRYSAHPSETVGDIIYSYPDKFVIEFRDHEGKLIEAMPELPDCMLDEFSVNTTVGRMHGNDPIMTTINISFAEQHVLTRKSPVIDTDLSKNI